MAKAKITITGTPDKKPKFNNDGTVDLIFKIGMSQQVPKGLKSLGESFYLVHVAPKTWKKVSDTFKDDSFCIIQGESKASKTQSGTPLIEVVCFDISIKETETTAAAVNNTAAVQETKEKPKADIEKKEPAKEKPVSNQLENKQEKLHEPKIDKEQKPVKHIRGEHAPEDKGIKWFSPEEIIQVNTADVTLTEPVHLTTNMLALNGLLKAVSMTGNISSPIAVKPLENGKMTLVMGIRQYTVAKMLNIEKIPAVIREKTHGELTEELGIPTFKR